MFVTNLLEAHASGATQNYFPCKNKKAIRKNIDQIKLRKYHKPLVLLQKTQFFLKMRN
jgi:hypothetical protein